MIQTIEENMQHTIDTYTDFLVSKGRKSSTVRRYTYDIWGCFHYLLKEKSEFHSHIWESFTTTDYENYFFMLVHELHYSDKTLHRVRVALNQFLLFLVDTEEILTNPIENIELAVIPDRKLLPTHFLSDTEQSKLIRILTSEDGLTDKQLKSRTLLFDRNLSIVHLMLHFGLTLKEIVSIKMNHIHFEQNTITIPPKRKMILSNEDKQILYAYYQMIPTPVRPDYHSDEPFFVAFDYNRGTFRWVYETDSPKALTEISIQKMIRLEVARAGLRKGISAQYLRNTYILQLINEQMNPEQIMYQAGLTSKLALQRYIDFYYAQKEVDQN